MQKLSAQKNTFHAYGSIFVLALTAVLIGSLFWKLTLPRKDFYNELWGPASLLVRGQSPYDTASLDPILPAAWLPMAIGFFFPLGWLPEELALKAWYLFNIIELGLIVYLAQGTDRNLYNTTVLGLLCFFFPLTLNHINLGQLSITVMLCWILAGLLVVKDRHWLSALCIGLALSKPQLGFLAMLGLAQHDFLHGGTRAVFASWARILAVCLALCIPLFVAYPDWVPDAVVSMGKNPIWSYPSLYILLERYFGAWGHVLWGVSTLIVIGTNFWIWKNFPLTKAISWSLALGLLATPYVGSWDFVLLFPLLISTYVSVDWRRKVFLLLAYCVAWAWMAQIQMLAVSHNHYFWWVPLWFIGAAALVADRRRVRES